MSRFSVRHFRRAAAAASTAVAPLLALTPFAVLVAPVSVAHAAPPVQGLVSRPIPAAPEGADAVRVSIYGDKSGARVQVRLLKPGEDGVLTGYYAAPPVTVDFEGWKTVTLPLSDFRFGSDTNPESSADGYGYGSALTAADRVQFAVVARDARLFFADLGWASASGAPTDPLLAPMTPMDENSVKQWKVVGDSEQVNAVSFGLNKAAAFQKDGKPTLQMIVRNGVLNQRQVHQPVAETRLKARGPQPYFVYTRAAFETILPESVPTLDEIKAGPAISIFVCPDETEPASFAVYAGKDLKNATVRIAGPLTSATRGTLPASALNVRVVRAPETWGGPQILMKDDRQALAGALPTVRLTGDPATDIKAETSKQFWVTVAVGRNQKPGTYKGTLIFAAAGVKPTSIPFSVEVLDLPMRSAFLQYGMDFRSLLGPASGVPGGQVVAPEVYAAQLTDIRDHGFKNVKIHDEPPGLGTAFKLYREAGMNPLGPVIAASVNEPGEVTATEALRPEAGLTGEFAIYYPLPNDGAPKAFSEAVQKASRNARLIASVEGKDHFKALSDAIEDPQGDRLAPVYPLSADYAQQLITDGRRPITVRNVDYWSWNIALQNPLRNRLFAGLMLYSTGRSGSGVYGALAGPYQYVPEGMEPFAALAAADPHADPRTLPQMVTFPVQGGMLSTLQWEAVREGVDDVRYIGVLKGYSRDLKDLKIRKDATDRAESYLSGVASKPLLTQTATQLQDHRRGILREILKLKAIIQPSRPARRPAPAKPAPKKPAPKKPVKKGR